MRYKPIPALVLLLGLLLTGCQVEKFSMPTWDVTLNVPLMNENYYVSDLIDSVNFFADSTNTMYFESTGEIRSEEAGNIGIETNFSTGLFNLLSGQANQIQIPFSDTIHGRELAYGVFSSGRIWFQFANIDPALTDIQITFDEFKDSEDQSLVVHYNATAGLQSIDLTGYHVGVPNSATIVNVIHVTILAASSMPNGTMLGDIGMFMNEELNFSRFRGILTDYPMDVEDNSTVIDIDYPWGIENAIEIQEASILMSITNPMSFDAELHGYFFAENNTTNVRDSIAIVDESGNPYIIAAANGDVPSVTDIVFTNQVSHLLRIIPERIELRRAYFYLSSRDNVIGELTANDRIHGDYLADAPLKFILHNALITPKDSVEIEVSADNRETIEKNVLSAQMDLFVTNRIPVGAFATVYFGSDPNIEVADTTTWDFFYTGRIESSLVNSDEQQLPFEIPNERLMLFTNPKVYMKITFSFEETQTPITITASPADYIRVRSMLKVKVHVEEQ